MSPEINGNAPSVTKRKKNKKQSKLDTHDFNMSHCNYFTSNLSSYPNLNTSESTYYSMLNHSVPTEPVSLPIYPPTYQNMSYPNYFNILSSNPLIGNIPPVTSETNEYMSLPVGNLEQSDNSSKRRFSDPGLPNDSDSSSNSLDGRIIKKLSQQINALKESNRKLSREVMEMKMELIQLKQQNNRHFEREYEPGMLADIVREVRDAARVREDALLARVKHMIEEKQMSRVSNFLYASVYVIN